MIKNERQYRITRTQAEKFERALTQVRSEDVVGEGQPVLREAQADALKSQLGDLRAELAEYESLKSERKKVLELESFEELPRALVRARIASGLSQRELAEKLGIKEQQVQRYEATDYQSASLARVADVVNTLGLKVCRFSLKWRVSVSR
jgi:DNA-binding transcriptional regulator YiaG